MNDYWNNNVVEIGYGVGVVGGDKADINRNHQKQHQYQPSPIPSSMMH